MHYETPSAPPSEEGETGEVRPRCLSAASLAAGPVNLSQRGHAPLPTFLVVQQESRSPAGASPGNLHPTNLRSISSAVIPTTATNLLRELNPDTNVTCRLGTFSVSATYSSRHSFALLSTGGAARRIFSASPCRPTTSVFFAPGWTYNDSTTPSPDSVNQELTSTTSSAAESGRSPAAAPAPGSPAARRWGKGRRRRWVE